jgi:hypothetical protein
LLILYVLVEVETLFTCVFIMNAKLHIFFKTFE